MKRPFPIYLVAVWLFLWVGFQATPLVSLLKCQEPLSSQLGGMICLIGIIWAVMLTRLNIKVIYIAIAIFLISGVTSISKILFFLFKSSSLPPEFHSTRFYILLFLLAAFNIASFWYLVRPSFRKFAKEYVAERAKEKAAEKQAKAYRKQSQSIK